MRKAISFTLILCIILTPLVSVQASELEITTVEKVDELPEVEEQLEVAELPEAQVEEEIQEQESDNSLIISDEVVEEVLSEELSEEFGVVETEVDEPQEVIVEENESVDVELEELEEDILEQPEDKIEVIPLDIPIEDEPIEVVPLIEDEIVEDIIENTPDENIEQLEDELSEIPNSMVEEVIEGEIVEETELVEGELIEELDDVGVVENPIEELIEQQPIEQTPVEQQLPPVEQLPLLSEIPPEPLTPKISMLSKTTIIDSNNNYLTIENITEVEVVVREIIIEGKNGWKQVDYNDDFRNKKIGTKEFGIKINDLSLSDSYTVIDRMGSWFIEPYETVDFEIDIITAGQEKQITEEIFTIKVIVDLAEYHIQTITSETINNIIAIEQSIIGSMVQEELITEEIEMEEQIEQIEEILETEEIETEEQIEQIEEILETEEIKQDDLIHQEEELKVDETTETEEPVEVVNETGNSENIVIADELIKPVEEAVNIKDRHKDISTISIDGIDNVNEGSSEGAELSEGIETLEETVKSVEILETINSEEVENIAPDEETENIING